MNDVMADWGFNLSKRNATLNIPPFAKGEQLSTKACTETRRIASLRIHVEKSIQRKKKFTLLKGSSPLVLLHWPTRLYLSVQLFVTCLSVTVRGKGQNQNIEVGRLPSSFHSIKAIRKD